MHGGERPDGDRSPSSDGWGGCLVEGLGCLVELLMSVGLPVLLLGVALPAWRCW
ncbi:hypothetical protein [Sphingomonas bacterium]|uniref:hypothetical protein n=1 Tax=Sphingomonas bacterium TaxID=1895847 RepID=UPI00157599A8|nr:hypothetical protein [Sphingomonas bacterium]